MVPRLAEVTFYVLLLIGAAILRLWDLGPRAYHHDESLHAYYSWVLYTGGGFTHNPLMHGPFLFDITALGLFLFGDNGAAPRVFAALFGTALIFMPLMLRDRLGTYGAMATSVLIALSPSIFYFSRFIREDIFALVFELGVITGVWRYLDTKKNRYLYLMVASLALLFSTKETSYITVAVVGSFLLLLWSQRWLQALWAKKGRSKLKRLRASLTPSRFSAPGSILLVMGTLVLPLASALIGFLVQRAAGGGLTLVSGANNWQQGPVGVPIGSSAYTMAAAIALALFVVSAVLGVFWRRGVWAICFALFWGVFLFLHTTALSNMMGVGSGIWQSLGYWIAQQSVERGSQPWYYYLVLLPLYETLAFGLSLVAVIQAFRHLGRRFTATTLFIMAAAGSLAASVYLLTATKALYAPVGIGLVLITWLALKRGADVFDWFLMYWAGMSFVLYVVAGEKMPWLITHLTLPLAFMGGRYAGRLFAGIQWILVLRAGGLAVLLIIPGLFFAIRAMTMAAQWHRMPLGIWSFAGPLIVSLGALLVAMWLWGRLGRRAFLQMAGVAVIVLLGVFTLRSGFQAAFPHGDIPVEMLVYTQTSPEVAATVRKMDQIAKESGKGKDLPVLIDTADGFAWPWYWYLRGYAHVTYQDMSSPSGPIGATVVVLNANNQSAIAPSAEAYSPGKSIPFRQWFPENYRGYTASKFLDDFYSGASWSRMLNYYTYRKLGESLGHVDAVVYYHKDTAG